MPKYTKVPNIDNARFGDGGHRVILLTHITVQAHFSVGHEHLLAVKFIIFYVNVLFCEFARVVIC